MSRKLTKDRVFAYGFNFKEANGNIWRTKGNWTLATPKEVQQALKKEAVKRGFKVGVKYKHNWFGSYEEHTLDNLNFKLNNNSFGYNTLCSKGCPWIFKDGTWAEIIPNEITSDIQELIVKYGKEAVKKYLKDE